MANSETKTYDAIIIGSGQAGNPLMNNLTKRGKKIAMIERDKLGGSCINYGCTPTKTLIASSNAFHRTKTVDELGIKVENVELDFKKVMQRKNDIVKAFRGTVEKRTLNNKNVTLYRGIGKFVDEHTVRVELNDGGEATLSAQNIFIDTGSTPNKIPIDGIDDIVSYDSTSIMELEELPSHLVIIGTGYIALEFGQMFKRFGSRVTMIGDSAEMLGKEDEDVSDAIKEILEEDGVEFILSADTKRVEKNGDEITISIDTEKGEKKISASHLMLAVGRNPLTKCLDLENAGIEVDKRGHVVVDERLRTSKKHIYALGDVKGGPQFTHIAYDDYRIVMDDLYGEKKRTTTDRLVPYTLYIEPQFGRVGLSEKEAREKGYDISVGKIYMSKQGRPIEENYTKGFLKAVVNKEDGKILGASALCYQGGEVMAMIEIAMMGGLTFDKLRDAVLSHPSLSEMLNVLFKLDIDTDTDTDKKD